MPLDIFSNFNKGRTAVEIRLKQLAAISLFMMMLLMLGCGGGGASTPPPTYSVSGKIVYNSANVPNVLVHIASSGVSVGISDVSSDSTGTYTFNNVPAGTYTVSTTDSKYGFVPQTFAVTGAGLTIPDITAYPVFTVTGKISLESTSAAISGLTVTLYDTTVVPYVIDGLNGAMVTTATTGKSVQTDSSGIYTFNGVPAGSYTIKPSNTNLSTNYVFNPNVSSVFTIITGSSTIYVYNPDALGNLLIGAIIYNSSFTITDNSIPVQDFKASPPGGTGGVI